MRTRVIAISGGKGGVGKSSIAANLAVYYAAHGSSVLVIDADLGMADLNLLYGVAPDCSLLDVLNGEPPESVLVSAHGVHLLPGCTASSRLANITDAERMSLLTSIDGLENRFDTLVVDCAAGIQSNSVAFAAAASQVVVVATSDPTSLADAYACVKVLNREYRVERINVLPNSVRSPAEADNVFRRLVGLAGKFLDVRLTPLPAIPFDPLVRVAGSSGVPFVVSAPDGSAARALAQVAKRIDREIESDERPGSFRLFWRRALAGSSKSGRPALSLV